MPFADKSSKTSRTLRSAYYGGLRTHCIRGTAEIELLLAIPIILAIIFLSSAGMQLGVGRMDLVFQTEQAVLLDATEAQSPQYGPSATLQPPDGLEAIRPELPNRMHVAVLSKTVTYPMGDLNLGPVTLTKQAALLAPTWAYSSYPDTADREMLQDWFTTYVDESHASIAAPLGLQPAWTP